MSNKMKGVLKGLRYISQIFEEEEEAEMQIGFPTDVKHVAHIGWDGPTSNAPSWIQKFKDGEPEAPTNGDQQNISRDERRCSTGTDTLKSPSRRKSEKGKSTRRHSSAGTSTDSPKRSSASENKSRNPLSLDSPSRDSSSSSKTTRRKKTKSSSKSKQASENEQNSCQSSVLTGSENEQKNTMDDKGRQIPAM